MIRNESEYKEAIRRLDAEKLRLEDHLARLKESGLGEEEIKRVMDPIRSFNEQLQEGVTSYERLKRGEISDLVNLRRFGHVLVSLRIARGLSQRELAASLGVHESQISRDERNEYHGITIDRAAKILEELGARLTTQVECPPLDRKTVNT